MSSQRSTASPNFSLVLCLFFLSGFAGLLYEVAWFRRLQLVFGVSTFAIGAVVSAFMLGLAAGSRWAGNSPAVRRNPLAVYSILELGVGLYAVLFPALVVVIEALYSSALGQLEGHFLLLSALRFVLSLVLLLPATFCMGATLPTLALAVFTEQSALATKAGWLYAWNTLGGVAGTLAAGFLTLEQFGIRGTIWFGAGLNALIAAGAFVLSRRSGAVVFPESTSPGKTVKENRLARQGQGSLSKTKKSAVPVSQPPSGNPGVDWLGTARYAMLLAGLAGLVSMAMEVVWTRALVFYVHNSTYAFSAILAVYLLGLAAGAAAGAYLSKRSNSQKLIGWVMACVCVSTLLAILVYRHLPALMQPFLGQTLPQQLAGLPDRSFWVIRSWSSALAAIFFEVTLLLFCPAACFGLLFPLLLKWAQASEPRVSILGRFYAMNTFGSVIGTVLGSFILVPLLGTGGALVLLAWLPVPVAVLLFWRQSPSPSCPETKGIFGLRFSSVAVLGLGALLLVGLSAVAAPSGFYREMFARRFGPVLWFSEGVSETVAVCEHADKSAWIHYSDGRGASGTTSFVGGWLYAHLPLLLHPDPHSALVVCFGTGNTLGAARLHSLDRLDGVELSSEVPKAAYFFKETNHDVARDPRARIVIEDGRNYLLGTTNRYDVITEEPPMIHTAGVVNLYSRDFYQLCARRLTDNGIMAVWLATWELEDCEVKMLVRAFVEAFPHVSAWDSRHLGEWILIGSKQPLSIDAEKLSRRISNPALAPDLGKIGIRSAADLLGLYLKGDAFLRTFGQEVPPVTDDRSVVDYTIPREARANFGLGEFTTGGLYMSGVGPHGLVSELRVRDFDAIYTHREPADWMLAPLAPDLQSNVLAELKQRRIEGEALAGRKLAWNLMAIASDYEELKQPQKSIEILDWGMEIVTGAAQADLLVMKAQLCQHAGRRQEANQALTQALVLSPNHPKAQKLAAEMK